MNHPKILEVTYRTPRNTLETFWAEEGTDFGSCIRFSGCGIPRTATNNGTSTSYHRPLETITIPITLVPTTHVTDQPEWWRRTLKEATGEPTSNAKAEA